MLRICSVVDTFIDDSESGGSWGSWLRVLTLGFQGFRSWDCLRTTAIHEYPSLVVKRKGRRPVQRPVLQKLWQWAGISCGMAEGRELAMTMANQGPISQHPRFGRICLNRRLLDITAVPSSTPKPKTSKPPNPKPQAQ